MIELVIPLGVIGVPASAIGLLAGGARLIKRVKNQIAITTAIMNPVPEIEIVSKPVIETDFKMCVEHFKYGEFNEYLYKFIMILKEKGHEYHLPNFYEKLETLEIKSERKAFLRRILNFILDKRTSAEYDDADNTINIFGDNSDFFHECLHVITSREEGDLWYCGFQQGSFETGAYICTGLNEGYTSILEKKYFKEESGYTIEHYMAQQLEFIIGKNAMEDMYFENDLAGLIKEIGRYMKEEDILTFLYYLDIANDNFAKKYHLKSEIIILQYLFAFILKCEVKKEYSKIVQKNWTIQQLEEYIWHNYISIFLDELVEEELLSSQEIREILHEFILIVESEQEIVPKEKKYC